MAENTSNEDDEWEYEYSTTETETFFVDLDLSSVNEVIKSKNAGERKTLKPSEKGVQNDSATNGSKPRPRKDLNDEQDLDDRNGNEDEAEDAEEDNRDPSSPQQVQSPGGKGLFDDDDDDDHDDNNSAERMQILDLDTKNPVVSYNGNIYGCTWHDMLGTTMFVTKHQEAPFHEPEMSTEDYDLLGSSRIKLVGHRAKIVPKAGTRKRGRQDDEDTAEENSQASGIAQYVPEGRSLGSIKRTNPKTNIEIKRQANFLEQLMDVKKARGETDSVRTFVDRFTVVGDAKQARQARRKAKDKAETEQERQRREINELNRRVVKGDNDALERLQEIYAEMEEVEDDDEDLIMANANIVMSSAPPEAQQNHSLVEENIAQTASMAAQPNAVPSTSSSLDRGTVTTASGQPAQDHQA